MAKNHSQQFLATYRVRLTAAFILCSLLALLMLWGVLKVQLNIAEREFREEADQISSLLQQQFNSTFTVISALSGWHHSQLKATGHELSIFSNEILANFPHINSIQYMSRIDPQERDLFEEKKREEGYAAYSIKQKNNRSQLVNSSQRSIYFPITFIEPLEPRSVNLLGYDAGSDPAISSSIFQAIQTGQTVISKPTRLLGKEPLLLAFKAAYKGKIVPKDIPGRLTQIDGVFAAVMEANQLQAFVIDLLRNEKTSVFLYHKDHRRDEVQGQLIHYAPKNEITGLESLFPKFNYSNNLGNMQPFLLEFQRGTSFRDIPIYLPLSVLMVYLLVFSLIRKMLKSDLVHAIASEQAQDEIFKEKETAEVTLHSIADGVITADMDNRVKYMNEVAEGLTGWSNESAYARQLDEVFVAINTETGEPEPCLYNELALDINSGDSCASHTLLGHTGSRYQIKSSIAKIRDRSDEIVGTVIIFRDVTKEQELSRQMTHQARHDALTGLFNRREFEVQLNHSLEKSKNTDREDVLCYLDLDQFKVVNDTCGHVAGDELLKQLTHILHRNVRDSDVLARLGGDEFGLIIKGCSLDKAYEIASVLLNVIREYRFVWEEKTFDIGASMGLVQVSEEIGSIHEVMSAADSACYMAKDKGRNRIIAHTSDDHELLSRQGEMQWVHKIHEAFQNNRFRLFRQAVASLHNNDSISHYEVLIRMRDDEGNYMLPMAFIPAAERYNIMPGVDRWVIHLSLLMMAIENDDAIYNLNLSGKSLSHDGFLEFVIDEIDSSGVKPSRICFEITETAAIAHLGSAMNFITKLREKGCSFALDDFGSGLSSFSYLKNLPVDYLKIDGCFVKDMIDDPVDCAMVTCIAEVGRVMGIKTIAEFVENDEIKERLRSIGVDYAQGYAVASPEEWHLLASASLGNNNIAQADGLLIDNHMKSH